MKLKICAKIAAIFALAFYIGIVIAGNIPARSPGYYTVSAVAESKNNTTFFYTDNAVFIWCGASVDGDFELLMNDNGTTEIEDDIIVEWEAI